MGGEQSSEAGEVKPVPLLAEGTIDPEVFVPYQYRPLGHKEIRLLKLVPIENTATNTVDADKNGENPLESHAETRTQVFLRHLRSLTVYHRLELIHSKFDEAPPYEPISYTWGDPSRPHNLRLNNHSALKITKTLATCVPHFLKTSKTGHLWIDQLCINQEDNEEKGRQVALMGDIYRNGQQTLVWLGESDTDSDVLIEELKIRGLNDRSGSEFFWSINGEATKCYLTSLERDFGLDCHHHLPSTPLSLKMPVDRGPGAPDEQREEVVVCRQCILPHMEKLKKAMYRFFTRPWFSRAWVTQEAVLSKWNVFMVSDQTLSTTDLEDIPSILSDLQLREDFNKFTVSPGYHALHQIVSMRQDAPGTQGSEYTIISDLLDHFRVTGIQATNPRDYVYSILGIHPRAGQIFKPDYNLSVRELLIETARKLLDQSGGLHLFAHCDNVNRDFKYNLPSWVPDWTTKPRVPDTKPNVVCGVPRPLKKPTYASDLFSPKLPVHGKCLGTLHSIHNYDLNKAFGHLTHAQFERSDHGMLSALDKIAFDLDSRRPRSAPRLTKGSMLYELDLCVDDPPSRRRDGTEVIHWRNDGRKPVTSLLLINSKAAGRRFCIGDGSIVGLVPANAVAGDEVWLLLGSHLQYVLRMVGEGEYLLIGTCIWDWRRGPHSYKVGPGWAKFEEGEAREVCLV